MKNYEKLKSIIVKEIPEILELKFGCKVEKKSNNKQIIVGNFNAWQFEKNNYKILGRDITLEDVLIVLNEKEEYKSWMIGSNGAILKWRLDIEPEHTLHFWQLGKPLHEQSEETINFLLELLT